MTNTTKMTKREKFEMLMKLSEVKANPVLVDFITHEIELLDKKNASKKPTAQQTKNSDCQAQIIEIVRAEPDRLFTVTEFLKALDGELTSNQHASAVVRKMYAPKNVEDVMSPEYPLLRIDEKRKAFFKFNPNYED